MEENYYDKAIGWFERAGREDDLFVKFILLYISFEVLSKLKKLNKYKLSDSIQKNFFQKIPEDILDKLKKELDIIPLQNMQRRTEFIKLKDKKDFENVLRFVNVGRNNLFHGDKGLDNERDILIVTYGTKLLGSLIEVMKDG